jgi:hypothetical protein
MSTVHSVDLTFAQSGPFYDQRLEMLVDQLGAVRV